MKAATGELTLIIDDLKERPDQVLNAAIDDHFQYQAIRESSSLIEEQINQCKQFILQIERVISRLRVEMQTMNHILQGVINDSFKVEKNSSV